PAPGLGARRRLARAQASVRSDGLAIEEALPRRLHEGIAEPRHARVGLHAGPIQQGLRARPVDFGKMAAGQQAFGQQYLQTMQ
ncbi:hypothetical protein PPH41_29050, partial [Burkholderia gladioli]|nr:hypothetical protein [Burkholderia gladioli]